MNFCFILSKAKFICTLMMFCASGYGSKSQKSKQSNTSNDYALVTLITGTNNGYIMGAVALAQSLIEVNSKLKRYAMVTPHVPKSSRETLTKYFSLVEVKPIICNHVILKDRKLTDAEYDLMGAVYKERIKLFSKTCTKFHVFKFMKYKKILFMDSDIILHRNVDDVFSQSNAASFAAAPDVFPPDRFNSGVFVATPNIDSYVELIRLNKNEGSLDGSDQGVLNYGFCPDWHSSPTPAPIPTADANYTNSCPSLAASTQTSKCGRLPWSYNVYSNNFNHYLLLQQQYGLPEPHVAHFMSLTKPWVTLQYEYIKNYDINSMPAKIRGDLAAQASLHVQWRKLYFKATKEKPPGNRVLSQFLSDAI